MRTFLFLLFCGVLSTVHAQNNSDTSDLNMIRSIFGKEKKELVQQYLQLPQKDSAKFWEVYNDYEASRKNIASDRLMIIRDYARQYETLDNKSSEDLANRVFENDLSLIKLYQKYFKKVAAVIGTREAAKFFQLEAFIHDTTRTALQTDIPFIDELNNEKKEQSKQL